MNQILENKKANLAKKKLYIFQLSIILLFLLIFMFYILKEKYSEFSLKNIAKVASNTNSITRLYSVKQPNYVIVDGSLIPIIGSIEIPKLNLNYPILSECNDKLLKISVCKFYGRNLNEPGTICIAGHNYNNGQFFSNLNLLVKDDVINIYDTNAKKYSYIIYQIYESIPDNTNFLNSSENNAKEISLITCNNSNRKRLIVKAKRKGNL